MSGIRGVIDTRNGMILIGIWAPIQAEVRTNSIANMSI
jgi:hypothetical protein